jgi:hypothetical protein
MDDGGWMDGWMDGSIREEMEARSEAITLLHTAIFSKQRLQQT